MPALVMWLDWPALTPAPVPEQLDREPDGFHALLCAAFGDTRPESRPWDDMDPDDRWDAKHARSEERARMWEER